MDDCFPHLWIRSELVIKLLRAVAQVVLNLHTTLQKGQPLGGCELGGKKRMCEDVRKLG